MAKKQDKNRKDITLKSLKAQLRRLPEIEVPEKLKARLFAAIPDIEAPAGHRRRILWQPRVSDFGVTAAAIVLIFALMFMLNLGLSVPSRGLLTDVNDTSLVYPRWDHTTFICDQNAILSKMPTLPISTSDDNSK